MSFGWNWHFRTYMLPFYITVLLFQIQFQCYFVISFHVPKSKHASLTTHSSFDPSLFNNRKRSNDGTTGRHSGQIDDNDVFSLTPLLTKAEQLLAMDKSPQTPSPKYDSQNHHNKSNQDNNIVIEGDVSRRVFMGSSLIATSAIFATGASFQDPTSYLANAAEKIQMNNIQSYMGNKNNDNSRFGNLSWEVTPVNKRTGVTVFDAEKSGYNVRFVTYLARFLLVFDADCQKWWVARAADIPRRSTSEQVTEMRMQQFGAFSASVEVGLQEYRDSEGPKRLMTGLLRRYCPSIDQIQASRENKGLPPLTDIAIERELREIKEARRQIALLFGLLEINQPVEELTSLLAAIDNGSITSVSILDGGSGYAPGYGSPLVTFPPPKAGEGFETAKGRAVLAPNGLILRIDIINRGYGYVKPPTVTITKPGADRGVNIPNGRRAVGKAFLFRNAANKSRLERIELVDPGSGYIEGEEIRIEISPPELDESKGGVQATATAVLELEVVAIDVIKGGTGYAVEKLIPVDVEPPPLTARVNMNDPLMARIISPTEPLPATTIPSRETRLKMLPNDDPKSVVFMVDKFARNDGKGGGGGCIGRACYDRPVVAVASAEAEASSFTKFRRSGDATQVTTAPQPYVSGTSSGIDASKVRTVPFVSDSSSSQFLTLLPDGIGLQYDDEAKRFVLTAAPNFQSTNYNWIIQDESSNRPLDPEFGPRGRSPIEREMQLSVQSYLRFCASGAICSSGVHLILTPIDVVKTKVQTDADKYPGPISAFNKLVEEEGFTGFFSGWAPTFVGFFFWGGFTFSVTELLRRTFILMAGSQAMTYEVPIILAAAAIASFFGVFVLCPFEAVRIRSVAQPDYGKNILDVTGRMVSEEGLGTLFSAVPPFLLKEIPFSMAKFTVFDLTTEYLYEKFPAATEDIQLSLLISLIGGTLGGLVAAFVSNPGDATISEMKKAKSSLGPVDAVKLILERGGTANLFRGLPLRLAFYPLVVSLQFLVFDYVRYTLGIGSDDLKMYLDVLGGALKQTGGPL